MVRSNPFICCKCTLNIDNESYLSPAQFDGYLYDARCAGNWSSGMILFETMTNRKLFGPYDVMMKKNGFYALYMRNYEIIFIPIISQNILTQIHLNCYNYY